MMAICGDWLLRHYELRPSLGLMLNLVCVRVCASAQCRGVARVCGEQSFSRLFLVHQLHCRPFSATLTVSRQMKSHSYRRSGPRTISTAKWVRVEPATRWSRSRLTVVLWAAVHRLAKMLLRVFLLLGLLATVAFADDEEHDEHDHHHHISHDYGCCSHEDRREIQYLWERVWSSSFTHRKVAIGRAIFDESVAHCHSNTALSDLIS